MTSSSTISHRSRSPSWWLKPLILVLLLLLGIATQAAIAQDLDFFPLQVGNTWTYVDSNRTPPRSLTVSITDTQRVEGQTYYVFDGMPRLSGFKSALLYRKDEHGDVFAYDQEQQKECLLLSFSIEPPPGEVLVTWIDPCFSGDWVWMRHWTRFRTGTDSDSFLMGLLRSLLPGSNIFDEGRRGVRVDADGAYQFLFVSGIGIVIAQPELAWPICLSDAVIAGRQLVKTTMIRSMSWGALKSAQ